MKGQLHGGGGPACARAGDVCGENRSRFRRRPGPQREAAGERPGWGLWRWAEAAAVAMGGPTPQGPRFSISRRKGSDRGLNLPLSRRPAPGAFLHAGGTSAASVGHSPARSNFLARQRRLNLHPKDDSCACKTRVFADGNRADQEKNRAPFSMSCPGLGQVTVLPRKGLLLCVRTAERPLLRHPHPHGPSSAGAGISGPAPPRQATGEDGALSPREKGDNQTPPAARAAR